MLVMTRCAWLGASYQVRRNTEEFHHSDSAVRPVVTLTCPGDSCRVGRGLTATRNRRHAERHASAPPGDFRLVQTLGEQPRRPMAPLFQGYKVSSYSRWISHIQRLPPTAGNVTILCDSQISSACPLAQPPPA